MVTGPLMRGKYDFFEGYGASKVILLAPPLQLEAPLVASKQEMRRFSSQGQYFKHDAFIRENIDPSPKRTRVDSSILNISSVSNGAKRIEAFSKKYLQVISWYARASFPRYLGGCYHNLFMR